MQTLREFSSVHKNASSSHKIVFASLFFALTQM